MATARPSTDRSVYRLALYGMRSSGKTCILSALSLPRIPHPDGLSCSWIENVPGHALPSGDPSIEATNDPFHIGWQWLSDQRIRLRQGDTPAPNPNRETMHFLFDFGSPKHGTRRVELIDYSGELLVVSEGDLAAKLREHMRVCDGLLILAQAPYPGRDLAPLAGDLEKLKGAFLSLLNQRDAEPMQDWPIALLFNKWDRRTNSAQDGDGYDQESLDAFLNHSPPPPQVALIDAIKNAVGEENTNCFPVSAFGAHDIRGDGKEVPRLDGPLLKSRRLEDGFIWLTERIDSLRIERLEDAARLASWWAFPQIVFGARDISGTADASAWKRWFCGLSAPAAISAAWKLRRRFPKSSPHRARTTVALRTLGTKLASQVAICLVVVLAFAIGIETTLDGIHYRQILAARDDPSAQAEQLQQGEAWLSAYFTSPSFRHWLSRGMLLDRSEAHRVLAELRTQRDAALWETVANAEDPQTRIVLARKYLETFPVGLHHAEAETLIADADRLQREQENADYLKQVELEIDAISPIATTPLEVLHSLSMKIGKLPRPDATSDEILSLQQELRARIAQKQTQIAEASRKADWEKFRQTYFSLMRTKSQFQNRFRIVNRQAR